MNNNQKKNYTQKKWYMEWLRVISMTAVVFTHIGATAHTDFPDTYYANIGGVVLQGIVYLSHFAVPIFFMITGALLLNPGKEITIGKIMKKYVLRYSIVLLIFGWGYAYLEMLFISKRFVWADLGISFVNMLQGHSWAHMWYLYTLIGMLLVLPLLRAFIRNYEHKDVLFCLLFLFLFNSIFPIISELTGFKIGIVFPISSVYILYMLLGYVLDSKSFDIKGIWPIILEIFLAGSLIITAYYNNMYGFELPIGAYYSPVIIMYSVILFCLVKSAHLKENRIVDFLSGTLRTRRKQHKILQVVFQFLSHV